MLYDSLSCLLHMPPKGQLASSSWLAKSLLSCSLFPWVLTHPSFLPPHCLEEKVCFWSEPFTSTQVLCRILPPFSGPSLHQRSVALPLSLANPFSALSCRLSLTAKVLTTPLLQRKLLACSTCLPPHKRSQKNRMMLMLCLQAPISSHSLY